MEQLLIEMMSGFRRFVEASEDYHWFNAAAGHNRKLKDAQHEPAVLAGARQRAAAHLPVLDSTLDRHLKPDHKSILVNWLAHHMIRLGYRGEDYVSPPPVGLGSRWQYNAAVPAQQISNMWSNVSPAIHAQATNPEFFKALNKLHNDQDEPSVTFDHLRNDTNVLLNAPPGGPGTQKPGPEGRPLIEFPDGFKWVALDKSYCKDEGEAGGHCGNIVGQEVTSHQLVSLRDPKNMVVATFVIDKGSLGEAKGYGNKKLDPKYHMHVAQLLLAGGPAPLPITSTISAEDKYQPENDTTAIDLLQSDDVDPQTKQALSAKFQAEFADENKVNGYLSNDMKDDHRRKTIGAIYGHLPPDEQEQRYQSSKSVAHDKMVNNLGFIIPGHEDVKDYRKTDLLRQYIEYNLQEIKKIDAHFDHLIKIHDRTQDDGDRFAHLIYGIRVFFTMVKDGKFLRPYRQLGMAVDNPKRREIAKLLTKLGNASMAFLTRLKENRQKYSKLSVNFMPDVYDAMDEIKYALSPGI